LFRQVRALKLYRSAIPATYTRMIRSRAARCIQLLLDHKALTLQRSWAMARQKGLIPSRSLRVSKVSLVSGSAIPRLKDLHAQLCPPGMLSDIPGHYDYTQHMPLMYAPSSESDDSTSGFEKQLTLDDDP